MICIFSRSCNVIIDDLPSDPTICTDIVRTDGGRFDVSLSARQRMPIYWEGISSAIRRCTWFYRGNNEIMQPYNEDIAQKLEVCLIFCPAPNRF